MPDIPPTYGESLPRSLHIQCLIKLQQVHEGIREEDLDFHHLLGPVGKITEQHLSTKRMSDCGSESDREKTKQQQRDESEQLIIKSR